MEEALDEFLGCPYSRLPVYEGSLDKVVGLVYGKDLARHFCGIREGELSDYIREPRFVSQTTSVQELLDIFRRERIQMAVVLDQYGGTAGMVTFEDAVEEVVGEIQDEFDSEDHPIFRLDAERIQVNGDLLLEKLSQFLKLKLPPTRVRTVAELVAEVSQGDPKVGDLRVWEGLEFRVDTVQERGIQSVVVRCLPDNEKKPH